MKLFIAAAIVIAVLVEVIIYLRSRRRPETPAAHLRAGNKALNRGDLDAAAESFREAIRLDYSFAPAHYGLAIAAMHRDDFEAAIEHLLQCRQFADHPPGVHHALGVAHYHKGDLEGAIEHYRRAVELAPDDPDSLGALADVYHELGRTEEAKEVYPDYTPASPEEVERWERIEKQLSAKAWARIRRWDRVGHALGWVFRLSRVGVLTYLAFVVLSFLYNLVAGSGAVEHPRLPNAVRIAVLCALIPLYLSRLGMRAMEGAADTYLRRVMRGSDISEEDIEAVVPRGDAPPWWRVELSGFHLVLWLTIPVLTAAFRFASGPAAWMGVVAAYMIVGWIVKLGFWVVFLFGEATERRLAWERRYRWFGTLRGTLFALVAVPAGLVLCALLVEAALQLGKL